MNQPKSVLQTRLALLRSSAPSDRAQGIKELELLGDGAALPALAEVFATDPEPALRALAQWAGKSIYYNMIRQRLAAKRASREERRAAEEALESVRRKKQGANDSENTSN